VNDVNGWSSVDGREGCSWFRHSIINIHDDIIINTTNYYIINIIIWSGV